MKSSYSAKVRISECCGDYLSSYLFSDGQPSEDLSFYIPPRLPAAPAERKPRGNFPANVFGIAISGSASAFRKIFKIF